MDRLLRQTTARISLEVRDTEGELVSADPSTDVEVTVRDGAEDQVATGTADEAGTGLYEFELTPTQIASLDVYEATWEVTLGGQVNTFRTVFEVVGGHLFSIGEARGFDQILADPTEYPTSVIRNAREVVEDFLEDRCNVAFVPRAAREVLTGRGSRRLLLPHSHLLALISGSVDGMALTQGEIDELELEEKGAIQRPTGKVWAAGAEVGLHYEHGHTRAPADVSRAGLKLLYHYLIAHVSGLPERAIQQTTEVGTFTLSFAGERRPSGIPEVDAVIAAYREPDLLVG